MSSHARLSPSNHRWSHCPGSVRVEAEYPNVAGDAAIDGTGSHLLLELCLETGRPDVKAAEWIDRSIGEGHEDKVEGWFIEHERADRVQMALDYITRRRGELSGDIKITSESKSNPGHFFGRDDWWGTCDITIEADKFIEVADYKDGQGYVSEKNNPQLISYAAGKLIPHMMEPGGVINPNKVADYTVRMTIIQPKTGTPIRYQEMTGLELWAEAQKLAHAATLTDDPEAPLIPGNWCTWCAHGRAKNCSAKTDVAMKGVAAMTTMSGEGNDLMESIQSGQIAPGTMTVEQLSAVMDAGSLITKMLKDVTEEVEKRLKDKVNVPGYAMGYGNKKKAWKDDEKTVAKKLGGMSIGGTRLKKDEVFIPKIMSPAQALKLELSDRQMKVVLEMIEEKNGSPKVVKSVEVIQDNVETMFMGADTTPPLGFM